ncbi:BEN domain-containing protein 5 [Frankliniella fusca]|uniref:BEN domain-containing protein 5 n=1 Tax=Frankliniella fusca TaxID=407009 RepID=A0AAE1HEZ8_9NEOP|nr:BEN domain-containing protein 5 [Frankliniella fusca]
MGLIKLSLVRFTRDKFKEIVRVSDINGFTPRNKNDFKNKEVYNEFLAEPVLGSTVQTESEIISKRKRKILVIDRAKKHMLMNLDRDSSQSKSAEDSSERTWTEDKETTQSGSSLPSSSLNGPEPQNPSPQGQTDKIFAPRIASRQITLKSTPNMHFDDFSSTFTAVAAKQ